MVSLRLARGCRCFAAFDGERVLGYGWKSTGPEWIGEVGLEISPGAGEAYIWNCVTLPEYRRQGVFRRVLTRICNDDGLARLWIASLAGTAEGALPLLGFEPVLTVQGESAEPAGPLAADGFAVLGLKPGEPVRPGPPRRH
ncbi:MAG TPA: GNAT family N-acetyltransferase [Solirubrobacterales bacterium]|nr:GNAT family N-acetyltransferase [Solirubrobacterales bacterium]